MRIRRIVGLGVGIPCGFACLCMGIAAGGGGPTTKVKRLLVTGDSAPIEYARCGGDRRPVGGGLSQRGEPGALTLHASFPVVSGTGTLVDRWGIAARNADSADKRAKAFAICARDPKVNVVTEEAFASNDQSTGAVAKCPAGRRVIGGGVIPDGTYGVTVKATAPLGSSGTASGTADGDVGRFWYAAIAPFTGERSFTVYALCARDSKAKIRVRNVSGIAGQTEDGSTRCPRRERAVSGGVTEIDPRPPNLSVRATGPPYSAEPGIAPRRWYAAAQIPGPPPGQPIAMMAICE